MAGTLAHMFLPRQTSGDLGELTARSRLTGKEPPFIARYPNFSAGLYTLGGAATGAVGGGALGAGTGAVVGGGDGATIGLATGGLSGAAIGALLGTILAGRARSRIEAKMRADTAQYQKDNGELNAAAVSKFLAENPNEMKSSPLSNLFLGQGGHSRARLGEYKRIIEGEPDLGIRPLGAGIDIANYAGAAMFPGLVPLGAAVYDTVKAEDAERDLIRAQAKLGKTASSDTSPQGDNNIKTKVPEAKRVGGRKTQSKKVSVVDFDGSKAGLLANAAKCQKKA